jgi:diapolycopene oxygenase
MTDASSRLSDGPAPKRVIVIGAGLGGISAAISLAQRGYRVEIHEKNEKIGGKLNVLRLDGYSFDLGPSILTLPHLFQRLFERSNRKMEDYFRIVPVRPHWRCFFEDGKCIDLDPDPAKMAAAAEKAGEEPKNVEDFLAYSGRLYDLIDSGYFQKGLETTADFARFYGKWKFLQFDLFRNMHGGVSKYLKTPHMRDIFDYFIKYVGSSAYRAPAFMNCLPTIQFRHDLWYVEGGLYNIALGLRRLLEEIGVAVYCNSAVAAIRTEAGRATGIETADGTFHPADIVVSNMEVVPACRDLLKLDPALMAKMEKRLEPACSGLIIDIGLKTTYPQLAHHNFFFSRDQKSHFRSVFRDYELPGDPTIYLVAASKTDHTVAPAGCDCLKILPHIPHIRPDKPLSREDYSKHKEQVYDKLERMGLRNLRQNIVVEHMWTPLNIQQQYNSNRGSIYGVVTDRFKNFGFKAPAQSSVYPNVFFVGGSVNPGGGMPMVVLCGQVVSEKIARWDGNGA